MKVGDQIPVTIDGIPVAQAVVEKIESDRATLSFEGHRVVMAIRVQLVDDTPQVPSETETIITGVDRPEAINSTTVSESALEAATLGSDQTHAASTPDQATDAQTASPQTTSPQTTPAQPTEAVQESNDN